MPEGRETPPQGEKNNAPGRFSRLKTKLSNIIPRRIDSTSRPITLEEQLKAAGRETAEPPLTTAEHARRHRAEQIRQQQKELDRLREEHGSEPHWGNIEEITYRELVENGKLKEAERYREVILREIKNRKKKE